MKKRRDLKAEITQKIVDRIEQGGLLPWICPWDIKQCSPIPVNFGTKKAYTGMNVLLLWMEAVDRGYSNNQWLTFKQAKALGGSVRRGEKSTTCIFYKSVEIDDEQEEDGKKQIPVMKPFNVFNVEQIDGLELPNARPIPNIEQGDLNLSLVKSIEQYCKIQGIALRNGGNRAYYSPSLDLIKIPDGFFDASGMAATLAHEAGHSTGHKKRLDRFEKFDNDFDKEIEAYAFEELVAETFSALLCGEYGVPLQTDNHASYLNSWLKAMKGDTSFIFKAASHAYKAFDYFQDSVKAGGASIEAA